MRYGEMGVHAAMRVLNTPIKSSNLLNFFDDLQRELPPTQIYIWPKILWGLGIKFLKEILDSLIPFKPNSPASSDGH